MDIPIIPAKPIPDLDYINKLPFAKSAEADPKETNGKMFIRSGWAGNAVANESRYPDNPSSNNFVVGVNGRGSLQIAPKEFDELLSSMLAVARLRAGFEPSEKY